MPGAAQSNREQERTIKGHCVHRAKIGILECSNSRMTNTNSTLSALSQQSLQRTILQQAQSLPRALQHKTWLSFHPLADPTLVEGQAGTPHAPSISLSYYPGTPGQQLSKLSSKEDQKPLPTLRDGVWLFFEGQAISPRSRMLLPVSMDRVVVFPAPLCPNRTVICPSYMFTVRSFTASFVLFPTLKTCGDHVHELVLHFRQVPQLRPAGKAPDGHGALAVDNRSNSGPTTKCSQLWGRATPSPRAARGYRGCLQATGFTKPTIWCVCTLPGSQYLGKVLYFDA